MSKYVNQLVPGFRYGNGVAVADADAGLFVTATGNNSFAVLGSATARPFGMLAAPAVAGEPCAVWCCGGIYETDQYVTTNVVAGCDLSVDASTNKLKLSAGGNFVVGHAISVVSGVLTFKLLV